MRRKNDPLPYQGKRYEGEEESSLSEATNFQKGEGGGVIYSLTHPQ